jgi:hypothetical protein
MEEMREMIPNLHVVAVYVGDAAAAEKKNLKKKKKEMLSLLLLLLMHRAVEAEAGDEGREGNGIQSTIQSS